MDVDAWTPSPPEDRLLQQLQRELAQLVPGGRLVIATQSGHDIPHEQPELVLDAIRDVVRAADAPAMDSRREGRRSSERPRRSP